VPAGDEPTVNDRNCLVRKANFDRPLLHHPVGANDEGVGALGAPCDRRDRHGESIAPDLQQKADIDELPGPQCLVGIVEGSLVGDGRRRRVNLVVDHCELAGPQVAPVAILGNNGDVALLQSGTNLRKRRRSKRSWASPPARLTQPPPSASGAMGQGFRAACRHGDRPVLLACLLHVLLPHHRRFLGAGLHLNQLSRFRGPPQSSVDDRVPVKVAVWAILIGTAPSPARTSNAVDCELPF
jgi:hypothetical protein